MAKITSEPSIQRFANLNELRRQLEEMANRVNRSESNAEVRRLAGQEPTLVIRGK